MEKINFLLMLSIVFLIPSLRRMFFAGRDFKKSQRTSGRSDFFDFARGVSILAVVQIHVAHLFLLAYDLAVYEKMFLFFLNNLSRFAIGIFFISAGVLLKELKNTQDYFLFLKNKFFKIFLPYSVFTVVLGVLFKLDVKEIFYNIFSGNAAVPFYFVVVLFQFYFIYPLVQKFISKEFLLFSFFVSALSFLLPTTWGVFGTVLFFKYFFFFVYGVYYREKFLNTKDLKNEKRLWLLLFFLYIFLALILPAFYFNIRLVYGVAVFNLLFLYQSYFLGKGFAKIFLFLGKNSLWIFLFHYPILQLLYPFISELTVSLYFSFFLLFISGTLLSVFLSTLMKQTLKIFVKKNQ